MPGERGRKFGSPVADDGCGKFPTPSGQGFRFVATADGGGNLAPPCDLGFYRSTPFAVPPRRRNHEALNLAVHGGAKSAPPWGCPATRPVLTARPVDKSAYSASTWLSILDVVVRRSYLFSMTTTAQTTATTVEPPPPGDASESFGARLAVASRHRQGLGPGVSDPAVLAELRELCAAPRPTRGAGVAEREGPAS